MAQGCLPTVINQGTSQPGGVIVYQMTIRYALINGHKVTGGVRVQLDTPNRTGYVQIISLLNEVYLTHYVTSMSFLPPSSAAGVAWSAIPWNSGMKQQCTVRDCAGGLRNCLCKPSTATKVETAQVIFCDPNHAQRFKTVLDTIAMAFTEVENMALDPCLPYQRLSGPAMVNCLPTGNPVSLGTGLGLAAGACADGSRGARAREQLAAACDHLIPGQQQYSYNNNMFDGDQRQMTGSPYPECVPPNCRVKATPEPIPVSTAGCQPCCPRPLHSEPIVVGRPMSSAGQPYEVSDPVGDPYAYPASHLAAGQLSSQISGQDPYAFTSDRILFNAAACLVRLERMRTWRELYRGNLKIVQRARGTNFSLVLESPDGNILSHHFVTPNMKFEQSCKTQFGYTFQAPSRGLKGTVGCSGRVISNGGSSLIADFLISFQTGVHFEQFRKVMEDVQRCLQTLNAQQPSFLTSDYQ